MEPWYAELLVLLSLFTPVLIARSGPVVWLPAFIINMLGVYATMILQAVGVAELWRAMTYVEIVLLVLNVGLSIMRSLELFRAREKRRYESIIQPP